MNLLKELLEMADDAILLNGFDEILNRLNEMREITSQMLSEGFMDNHRGDLDKKFDELETKLINARRGLGKLNTAEMSQEEKNKYKSDAMRNINVFRKQLYDLMLEMGMSQKETDYHVARIGLDREYGKPNEVFNSVPATQKDPSPEGNGFRAHMNKSRNLDSPENAGSYVRPATKGNNQKWYQKLFNRNRT